MLTIIAPEREPGSRGSEEWIVYTPEGYYHGSAGAARYMR